MRHIKAGICASLVALAYVSFSEQVVADDHAPIPHFRPANAESDRPINEGQVNSSVSEQAAFLVDQPNRMSGFYISGIFGATDWSDKDPEDIEVLGVVPVSLRARHDWPIHYGAAVGYRLNENIRFEVEYTQGSIDSVAEANLDLDIPIIGGLLGEVDILEELDATSADTKSKRLVLNTFFDYFFENFGVYVGFGAGLGTLENDASEILLFFEGEEVDDPEYLITFNGDVGATIPLPFNLEVSPHLRYTYWLTDRDDSIEPIYGRTFRGLGGGLSLRYKFY